MCAPKARLIGSAERSNVLFEISFVFIIVIIVIIIRSAHSMLSSHLACALREFFT